MKKTITFLTFFLGVITFASTAQDAAIKNTLGIGPRVGYYKADDADEGNFYGGLQLRLRPGPIIGIEGAVEYRAGQDYDFGTYTIETSFVPITASLLLFIPVSEYFAPYGLGGIGAYYTIYDSSGDLLGIEFDNDDTFNLGYHLGFGAEFPFSGNAALNIDYRYLFLNPDENEEALEDADFSGNVFTAGLMFYF